MKTRGLILIATFVFAISMFGQSTNVLPNLVLPIVKKGNWYLKSSLAEIKLSHKITFIEIFDSLGFAIFNEQSRQGIINSKGEIVQKADKQNYIALGEGYFNRFKNGFNELIIFSESGISENNKLSNVLEGNAFWTIINKENNALIFNLKSKIKIQTDSTFRFDLHFDFLVHRKDSNNMQLYNKCGKLILDEPFTIETTKENTIFETKSTKIIVNEYSSWTSPKNTKFYSQTSSHISFNVNGLAHLIQIKDFKEIMVYPADQLSYFSEKEVLVTAKNKSGLLSMNKTILIPIKYDWINKVNDTYQVTFNSLRGYYNTNYKEVLPCRFTSFSQNGDLIYTSGLIGSGLWSLKTNTALLDNIFDKIELKNNIIKSWLGNKLFITTITPEHDVLQRVVLKNAITLLPKISFNKRTSKTPSFDSRLLSVGWFYEEYKVQDKIDTNLIRIKLKWGLKYENDSILLKPIYPVPTYVQNAWFGLLSKGKIILPKTDLGSEIAVSTFTITDLKKGKKFNQHAILKLDTMDMAQGKSYARFGTLENNGILYPNGDIRLHTYFDSDQSKYLRYCDEGELTYGKKKTLESFPNHLYMFGSDNGRWYAKKLVELDKNDHVTFVKATWNFLKPNGDSLFKTPFQFALPFYKETAIVRRKSGWGLICDSLEVIPAIYSSIVRLEEFADTVYKVGIGRTEIEYLDNNLEPSEVEGELIKQGKKLLLFESKNLKQIVNEKGKVIFKGSGHLKLHDFDCFVEKNKKTFTLYNSEGNALIETSVAPLKFWSSSVFSIDVKNKNYLLSVTGDTLCKDGFESVISNSAYILVTYFDYKLLLSSDGVLIKKIKKGEVLLDQNLSYWAHLHKRNVTIYENGKIIQIVKSKTNFTTMNNKCFFSFEKHCTILFAKGKEKVFNQELDDFNAKDEYLLLNLNKNTFYIFDFNGKQFGDSLLKKNVTYLGNNVFQFYRKNHFERYNFKLELTDTSQIEYFGNFENGCVQDQADIPNYINEKFEVIKENEILQIEKLKTLKSVNCANGECTLSDGAGRLLSYMSYKNLKKVNDNLYSTSKPPLYGIVRKDNTFLVPAEFEKIQFVNAAIIRVVHNGEIGYYSRNGEKLF